MRFVRTLQHWWAWTVTALVVILGTPVVALIYAVTAPFDPGRYAAGRAFRLVGVTALRLNSLWRFHTRGSLADARRPYVVVANHESYADVFLISCFPWEMKWLSKDTMFKLPFMGWMMQMAGDIKLVRGNRDSAADAILQCRDRLKKNVSVMIFPEGTRSRSWEMLPFKDGAFRLAIESGAPILPIAVAGTRDLGLVDILPVAESDDVHAPALKQRVQRRAAKLATAVGDILGDQVDNRKAIGPVRPDCAARATARPADAVKPRQYAPFIIGEASSAMFIGDAFNRRGLIADTGNDQPAGDNVALTSWHRPQIRIKARPFHDHALNTAVAFQRDGHGEEIKFDGNVFGGAGVGGELP